MSFRRILVANRGEIACRILRTARSLGRATAAVYSDADRDAPFVRLADRAMRIGAPFARESYLKIDTVIAAARAMDCDAIHPGYGFLSENADFAAACAAAQLHFIGPPVPAIQKMGDKARARKVARENGVLPVPGYEGADDQERLLIEAHKIGFPLLVKATHGGGGKGLRRVGTATELGDAVTGARREALAAFGNGTLLLERYVHPARHVEVQILADTQGTVLPLLERECSLQRRHQKVVEECPSPVVDPQLRHRIGEAAQRLARAVGYVGAGTVEFLLEESGEFWFLEMNTRLQVEHGVTELVTGEDIVAWQIRIAEGEPLHPSLAAVAPRGAAIEVRLCAEDPERDFLPEAGRIRHLAFPFAPGVRIDSGVVAPQEITPHYDPMIAKVLAHGHDREEARQRLVAALRSTEIIGPRNNLTWLIQILESEMFRRGATFTHVLESMTPPAPDDEIPDGILALAAVALARENGGLPAADKDRFASLGGFRIVSANGGP